MRTFHRLVLACLITLGGALPAAEGTAVSRVPLLVSGGTLACMGVIDGRRGLLLIDSGASTTCLFPAQAKAGAYAWRKVRQRCYTANGPCLVRRVADHAAITVGGATYQARDLAVLPEVGAPTAIGLLGCDFLLANRAVIDLEHGALVLHPRAAATTAAVARRAER